VRRWLLLLGLAYLLGAFPTGALVARAYGVDLRQQGSRRTGATNALRVLGLRAGVLVLAGDVLKGWLATTLAARWGGTPWALPLAALCAMVGHTYSLFLGGRGGRGVATGLGALLVFSPSACLIAAAIALPVIAVSRYVSLGSIVGASVAGLALAVQAVRGSRPRPYLLYALLGPAFILFAHRDNLARLRAGTEPRLGDPQPGPPAVPAGPAPSPAATRPQGD